METFSIHNLQDLENFAESEEVEFKLAHGKDGSGELPQDFWKSYSAMANAHGGWIILGVKEKNGQFTVAGLDNIEKIKTNLFNLLNNRNHISANLLLSPENIQIQTLDKKKILVIQIPQAVRKQKPVHWTKNPFGNTYIRIHDADRLCDDDLIKRHADYSERTPILIEKHFDCFEFRNPGNLRLSKKDIFVGGLHDCRNGTLHQMFIAIGLGERAGSGIPKILKGCEFANWSQPSLQEKLEPPTQTLLTIYTASLIPFDIQIELEALFPDFSKLSNFERLLLATAWVETEVSHQRCCELTSMHTRDVTLTLQKLMKKGFLLTDGKVKHKRYFLAKNAQVTEQVSDQITEQVTDSINLLLLMLENEEKSMRVLLDSFKVKHRPNFLERYIRPALNDGLIELTIPDKPNSPKQQYRLTVLGRKRLAEYNK